MKNCVNRAAVVEEMGGAMYC